MPVGGNCRLGIVWVWVGAEVEVGVGEGEEAAEVKWGVEGERTGIRGVSDLVMAWTPWKVPARTR